MSGRASPQTTTGVVLAGGASRRMGTPKAQLTVGGATLLHRVLVAGAEAGIANWLVVGGDESWVQPSALAQSTRWIPDSFPDAGPLGAIVTALEEVSSAWLLLLSCDLVSVDPVSLRTLIAGASENVDAVVPRGSQLEVLHALYRTEALRPVVTRFADGARRMQTVLEGLRVREFPLAFDQDLARSTRDVDTPEQFRALVAEE
jgi:molybdenum cofactor guanylyltransferase